MDPTNEELFPPSSRLRVKYQTDRAQLLQEFKEGLAAIEDGTPDRLNAAELQSLIERINRHVDQYDHQLNQISDTTETTIDTSATFLASKIELKKKELSDLEDALKHINTAGTHPQTSAFNTSADRIINKVEDMNPDLSFDHLPFSSDRDPDELAKDVASGCLRVDTILARLLEQEQERIAFGVESTTDRMPMDDERRLGGLSSGVEGKHAMGGFGSAVERKDRTSGFASLVSAPHKTGERASDGPSSVPGGRPKHKHRKSHGSGRIGGRSIVKDGEAKN